MKLDGYLLLSILALALIFLNFAVLPAASATCTATSARASLFSHWRHLFPASKEIPAFLLSKSSPLTATQIATFASYIDSNTLNTTAHLSAFCSAANVLCSDNHSLGDLDAIVPNQLNFDYQVAYKVGGSSLFNSPRYDPARLEPGLFFREANMTVGQKLHIPDIRYKMPKTSFLPKCLSDKLPLSSKYLQSLVELLGMSRMQHLMSRTISECEVLPSDGEHKCCVQSIEGMADFAAAMVGPKAEVLATQSADGSGQEAMVAKVLGMNGMKVTPTVACHYSKFPYLVYYCHSLPAVKVYQVELLIGNDDTEKITNTAVAVCHMDTSKWSAEHISFAVLGSAPGKTEVCHLVYEGEFAWVARH